MTAPTAHILGFPAATGRAKNAPPNRPRLSSGARTGATTRARLTARHCPAHTWHHRAGRNPKVVKATAGLFDGTGTPPAAGAGPLPVGKWSGEFANDVAQSCEFRRDGTATVTEPGRAAGATVTPLAGALLVVYEDDRVERWTPVGRRMVVEHWFPAAQFPTGVPVRGIADRAE